MKSSERIDKDADQNIHKWEEFNHVGLLKAMISHAYLAPRPYALPYASLFFDGFTSLK